MISVPDMEMGRWLDPGENETGLEGGGGAGSGPPERGKDKQLKPSKGGGQHEGRIRRAHSDVIEEDRPRTEWAAT
jgi:hypothetical protein